MSQQRVRKAFHNTGIRLFSSAKALPNDTSRNSLFERYYNDFKYFILQVLLKIHNDRSKFIFFLVKQRVQKLFVTYHRCDHESCYFSLT